MRINCLWLLVDQQLRVYLYKDYKELSRWKNWGKLRFLRVWMASGIWTFFHSSHLDRKMGSNHNTYILSWISYGISISNRHYTNHIKMSVIRGPTIFLFTKLHLCFKNNYIENIINVMWLLQQDSKCYVFVTKKF